MDISVIKLIESCNSMVMVRKCNIKSEFVYYLELRRQIRQKKSKKPFKHKAFAVKHICQTFLDDHGRLVFGFYGHEGLFDTRLIDLADPNFEIVFNKLVVELLYFSVYTKINDMTPWWVMKQNHEEDLMLIGILQILRDTEFINTYKYPKGQQIRCIFGGHVNVPFNSGSEGPIQPINLVRVLGCTNYFQFESVVTGSIVQKVEIFGVNKYDTVNKGIILVSRVNDVRVKTYEHIGDPKLFDNIISDLDAAACDFAVTARRYSM